MMLSELLAVSAGASDPPIRGKPPEQFGIVVPFRLWPAESEHAG